MSAVLALLDPRVRPVLLKVFLAVAVVAGLECAQTLVTGVRTNVRGSLWAWLAVVLPGALLLAGSTWSRRAGQASLLVLAVIGLFAWRSDIGAHQATVGTGGLPGAIFTATTARPLTPEPDGQTAPVVVDSTT